MQGKFLEVIKERCDRLNLHHLLHFSILEKGQTKQMSLYYNLSEIRLSAKKNPLNNNR